MASVVQSAPPSLPYNLTTGGPKPATIASALLSPRGIPLPLSPLPSSPPPTYRVYCYDNSRHPPTQSESASLPVARLPSTVYRPLPKSPTTPPRPPRPQTSLPNLRPTVIVSPDLISALPKSDRPPEFQCHPQSPTRPQAPSLSSSYSSENQFCTPLPSPAFFAQRTWAKPSYTLPVMSPVRSKTSSKSTSPRRSPTSSHTYYYNSKWQYENIASRDSITALPPPPLPPPEGPLPEPPTPTPPASPQKSPTRAKNPNQHRRSKSHADLSPAQPATTTTTRQPTLSEKIPILPNSHLIAHSHIPRPQHYRPSPDELEGSLPPHHFPFVCNCTPNANGEISIDTTYPPPPQTFRQRHGRKVYMLATFLAVMVIAAGILAGIIWRLARMCEVGCEGEGVGRVVVGNVMAGNGTVGEVGAGVGERSLM